MMTYLALNIVFLTAIVSYFARRGAFDLRAVMITLAILITLTAVFDNFIITAGIVGYDQAKILGVYIQEAPIEDFFYALLAAIIVPALWHRLGEDA